MWKLLMDNNYQGLFNSGKEHIFYLMRDRSFCQVLKRSSHCSPLVVPTSMGRLVLCMGAISTTVEITSDTTSCPSRSDTSVTKCIPLIPLNLFTHDYLQCVHGSRQPKSNKFHTQISSGGHCLESFHSFVT
jgi:hypothetical protein